MEVGLMHHADADYKLAIKPAKKNRLDIIERLKALLWRVGRLVLRNDPGMRVIRHADAGYDVAKDTAKKNGLDFKDKL